MRNHFGRVAMVLAIAAFVAVSGGPRAQEPTPDAARDPTPASPSAPRASALPKDLVLRQAYEDLVASIRALQAPTDEDIAGFEQRILALAERLVASSENAVAFSLCDDWCQGVCVRRGRPKEALLAYARVGEIFRRNGDEGRLAGVACQRGNVLASLSSFEDALAEFGKAASIYEKLGDARGLASTLANRGIVFGSVSRHDEALAEFGRAATALERLGDEGRLAQIAQNRGIVFGSLSRYEEALAEFGRAASIFEKLGDERSLAGIHANRGSVFFFLSRYEEAHVEYGKAERVFEKLGDERGLADIAVNRGNAFTFCSRYEQALAEYGKAAPFFEKVGDVGSLARIALGRGNVFSYLSRYEEALVEFGEAASIFEDFGDEGSLARIAQSRGLAFASLSRHEEALAEFGRAASVFEKLGDEASLAAITMNRGKVLFSCSRNEEALAEYGRAARVFEKLEDEGRLAAIAANRGSVLVFCSRPEEALAEYGKAAHVFEKLGDEGNLARIAAGLGLAFESLSRYKEALASFSEAASRLETVLQSQVQKLGETSSVSFREGCHEVVRGALRSARAIADLTEEQRAATYKTFGVFMGLGTAELIAERGRSSLSALPEKESKRVEAIALEIRQAVANRDKIHEARRRGVAAEERKKLDDELGSNIDRIRNLEIESSVLIEQARQRQQVKVGIQYPKAATATEVQTEIETDTALLEYAVDDGEMFAFVTTRACQRLVALGEAKEVLEGIEHVRSALVLKAAPPPDLTRLRRLGARLLDPVLSVLPEGAKIKTLLIAGHGDLARIPFDLLLLADPKEGASPAERPYLVSRYDVAYVHSGTVMRSMRLAAKTRSGKTRNGPEFVGFGFPYDAKAEGHDDDLPAKGLVVGERADRGPLPGTAAEVLEIARIFANGEVETNSLDKALRDSRDDPMTRKFSTLSGERFELHLRTAATEEVLKQNTAVRTARILHLACHGEADLISPSLSRLVLAQSSQLEKASGEDGFVYIRELRELQISAELLVLSACETNAGKLHPLEGITGLSRAGLAAGAESVISTFWRVEDESARTLMVDFYRRWLGGGMTRIAALCETKRQAIRSGLPMKAWSAYALWDAKTR